MGAIEIIKDIGTTVATSGLNKEVISLLEKKLSILTDELVRVTADLEESASRESKLQRDNAKLRQQLQDLQPVGFVEHMGALWKRTKDGFEELPYCKHCKGNPIMGRPRGHRVYICGTGEHQAPLSIHPPQNEEG